MIEVKGSGTYTDLFFLPNKCVFLDLRYMYLGEKIDDIIFKYHPDSKELIGFERIQGEGNICRLIILPRAALNIGSKLTYTSENGGSKK